MKKCNRLARFEMLKNRIDRKEIDVCFLVTSGRAGSNLMQTLLDQHPQILMTSLFQFYIDCDAVLKKHAGHPKILIDIFIRDTDFSRAWYQRQIDTDKNRPFNLNLEAIAVELEKILRRLDRINRKNFLIALHLAYAEVYNIDLKMIKVIVQHHHYLISSFC